MFTIDKKLIYIDNKKHHKMKKSELIKWVDAGRYMSNNNKHQYIPNWTCIFFQGETRIHAHALKESMINIKYQVTCYVLNKA